MDANSTVASGFSQNLHTVTNSQIHFTFTTSSGFHVWSKNDCFGL